MISRRIAALTNEDSVPVDYLVDYPVDYPIDYSGEGHPRRRMILLVLCLSLLVVVIDSTVLNTALPTLARVLPAGTSALQWITDAYTLCFAALLIPAGALGDRFGRRRSLVAGLVVYALGSLAAAFATGTHVLIADRVIMGTDYPFDMAEYNPIGHIAGVHGMDEATLAQIAGGNAARVLGLDV